MAKRIRNNPGDRPKRPTKTYGKSAPAVGWKSLLTFALILIAIAAASTWYKLRPDAPVAESESPVDKAVAEAMAKESTRYTANTGLEAGYVGSESCAKCHEGIAKSFNHIAMGRSLYRPTQDNIIEDYKNNEFYHEPSDQYFRMTNENGHFYQTRFQKAPDGSIINEKKVEVSYIVGSGNHSRSYVHREPDGKVYQLPVAWYTQEHKWAMNPGYDNKGHINFSRRITYDCLFCHASYPELSAGADQYNYGETAFFPDNLKAIDCERCHGPAQRHVQLAQSGAAEKAVRDAILNPADLSNKLQLEVCMQCHLETTSGKLPHSVHTVGKGIFGYRPGEPLEKYRYAFNHPKGTGHDDKFEIAGQAYRMRMSQCFIKSEGRMTCTTCHDPHRVPKDRLSAAIQSCLECHKPADCTEKMELRLPVKDNCIQCHMPQRRTDDAIHVIMTDHYIQRRPPPPDVLLAPKQEHLVDYHGDIVPYYPKEIEPSLQNLYMGLAYIANAANLDKGINYLNDYMKQSPDSFPAIYTRGVALKLLGRMADARTDLEHAVKLEPANPQAWMALGDLYETLQNYDRSLECYRTAIKIAPNLSRAHNGEGTSLMLSGNLDGAVKSFQAAIPLDPFDENPHLNLSYIALRKGDMKAAEAEARVALAINPSVSGGWMHLAECAVAAGRNEEAIWTSLESLKYDGARSPAFQLLNSACRNADATTALVALDKATHRQPFCAKIMTATTQLRQNDIVSATVALEASASMTTAVAALPAGVAVALNVNRPNLALLWGEQAHESMPGNDEALIQYVAGLRATGQGATAESLLKEALSKARSPRIANALAWLYATAQDPGLRRGQQAVGLANEAARMLGKPNVFVLQSQAAAAAECGQFGQANQIASQALEMANGAKLPMQSRRIEAQLTDYKAGRAHHAKW